MECQNYIVPVQVTDECQGERIKTGCVYSPNAYTLLELPENSTQEQINNALVIAINAMKVTNDAQQLIIENLELRVIDLETP